MTANTTAKEREFLERSLADLDRELAAGDLTEADHRRLRADYERRLRGEAPPPKPPARPGFVVAAVAFVAVVAVAAGVLVAQAAGRRDPGENITGGVAAAPQAPATTLPDDLARCTTLTEGGAAIDCFMAYTSANPDDPQGYVQFGLFSITAGIQGESEELLDAGQRFLEQALALDPDDPVARVYLAVVLDRRGQAEGAAAECERLAGMDVPADLSSLVDLACGT